MDTGVHEAGEAIMIQKLEFGATGHHSTRIIFGAAALGAMSQDRADRVLESVFENGVNHIDVAASYGKAEDRLAPWLRVHRKDVFLATKTGERGYEKARASIHLSLERMGIEQLDMIQLHNLTDEPGWQRALGQGGCLEAAVEAREEGLVRFIGITGHGTQAAAMHLNSLERFDFDSVLTPYNPSMMQDPHYAADFERLARTCRERNVAVQTIKAIARRRWRDEDTSKRFSWYEPIRDPEALRRAVQYVLYRPGVFLNTTSDATLLPQIFEAAGNFDGDDPDRIASLLGEIAKDADALAIEPLFVRGVSEDVLLSSN